MHMIQLLPYMVRFMNNEILSLLLNLKLHAYDSIITLYGHNFLTN